MTDRKKPFSTRTPSRPGTTSRRGAMALVGGALLAVSSMAGAQAGAQAWPTKPIRLVVNFPPGGAADAIARAVAPVLSEGLKQQVVIENKPGANGNIGAESVAKSPADGYTFLMSSGSAITVNPLVYTKMSFDPVKELTPVASVARVLVFLVVNPSVPVNNVAEFIAYAKANPGKLSYGSPGSASSPHLATEMFARQAKFEVTHVPYKGAGPALVDLLAGQIQFMFDPGPGLKHVKDGKLRLLAVGSPKRSPQVPDAPTLAEAGMTGFDADSVFGIYAPTGTPSAMVTKLHAEINKAVQTPRVAEIIASIGGEAAATTQNEFIELQRKDRERFGAFIKEANLKLD